ncbi:hypothetical protein [Ectobacillus ponti]|uniref:Uncharacterized protein n=1 Tax=Ectobacillus ponti TaxID=2961894 RepID=A0AA42BNL9_9BACI|nr:hypothetical protein [Ectobacillus ponti]MCP8967812.1 hypothetical protein [Ectobacillus ponti]
MKKDVRTAVIKQELVALRQVGEDCYEAKGKGIQVTAVRKQAKDGSLYVDLSGKGAKKYKAEILALLEEAGFAAQQPVLQLEISPHELGGYHVKGRNVSVTAAIKRGQTSADFGWEGYQLSGRGAEKHREEILAAIAAYREEQELHPLLVLPPSHPAQPGQQVRVIGNTMLGRQPNGKLDVTAEKEKYVGAVAEVKEIRHSLQQGTQYVLAFLQEELEEQQAAEGGHVFAKREVLPV